MTNEHSQDYEARGGALAHEPPKGQHTFSFTYDDTGAVVHVTAPNGWTMQRVVEEAYRLLGETRQPDDRVEFGGRVLDAAHLEMKVKAFVDAGLATDGKFHVVSKPGGAISPSGGRRRRQPGRHRHRRPHGSVQ